MQYSLALLGLAAAATAVTVAPGPADGCSPDYNGQFEITVVNASSVMKRDNYARQATTCGQPGILTVKLAGGMLTDAKGRIGSIVSNRQFQFDGPPAQAGAIYDGGFSVCKNGSLAVGKSAVFYECKTSNFYNLYDQSIGGQCTPVFIDIIPCAGSSPVASPVSAASTATVTQLPDGQPGATGAATPVSEYTDGQPQAPTALPPVSEFTDGQPQVPTAVPVSEFSDGQPQAPTGAPVPAAAGNVAAGSQAILALAGVLAAAML